MSSTCEDPVAQGGLEAGLPAHAAVVRSTTSPFTFQSLLRWEFAYVLVLLVWAFSGRSDALKALSNAFALLFVVRVAFVLAARAWRLEHGSRVLAGCVLLFGAANILVNAGQAQIVESVKILSLFMFYFAGETMDEGYLQRRPGFALVALFMALPLLTALFDLYRMGTGDGINEQPLSIFANRNNAVAFAVVASWALTLAGVRRWMIVAYLVVCVLAFKTLGALVAVAVALYFVYFGPGAVRLVMASSCGLLIYEVCADKLEIFTRAQSAWHTLGRVLAESGGLWGLAKLDYAQIYMAAGTSDISLIFRLKHWINLIGLYGQAATVNQLFGLGVGSSERLTDMRLVPHSDYLRFFFELGPGLFCCFCVLNLTILFRLGRYFLAIPAMFLCIYFFSENLVTNFPVMSFFYLTAGALVSSARRS